MTATRKVRESWTPNDAPCAVRHDRLAQARGGIIPETLSNFQTVPIYFYEPYQNTGFIVLCRRIASSVMACFLSKVVLLLPQRTNIAREQMVMACGKPLVLKMPFFFWRLSHASGF